MRLSKLSVVLAVVAVVVPGAARPAQTAPQSDRNFAALLHSVTGNAADGVGALLFRQPEDAAKVVFLDVVVLHLEPGRSYLLQRATDGTVDDDCTGTNWLTLGQGVRPEAIVPDGRGAAVAHMNRDLAAVLTGTRLDIHFRLIDAATANSPTPTVVLTSSCHQFTVLP
jgi:hypothetical protein